MNQTLRRIFIGGDKEGGGSRRPHMLRFLAILLTVILLLGLFFGLRLYKKHQADKEQEARNRIMQQEDARILRQQQQKQRQQKTPQPVLPPQNIQQPRQNQSLPRQNQLNNAPNVQTPPVPMQPKVQAAPPPMIHPDRPR